MIHVTGCWRGRTFVICAFAFLLGALGCTEDRPTAPTVLDALRSVGQGPQDSLAPLLAADHPRRIKGRYIVRFKPTVTNVSAVSQSIARATDGRVLRELANLKAFWGELPDQAIGALRRNPDVAYIEADVAQPIADVGDTTQSSPRWPLDRVDQRALPLNGTFQYSSTGYGVRIWIVDDGVSRTEPDLAGRIDENFYFTIDNLDPYAPCGTHGTTVARTAAGTLNGVAKRATIHSARVGNCDGTFSTGAASAAFEFIGDYSPKPAVINYSAGSACSWWGCGFTVDDAAKYARSKGVTVVVAAGNDGANACDYSPAHTSELITVAASNASDQRIVIPGWWASNYGPCVDLFAPVEDGGGTSNATPMVAGVAATILQLEPGASPAHVANEILARSTTGALSNIGSGSPNVLLHSRVRNLSAAIPEPSVIGPNTSCSWSATTSGGEPPYTYEWRRAGAVVATGVSYWTQSEWADFNLELRVTDGVGRTYWTTKTIAIDPDNTQFQC